MPEGASEWKQLLPLVGFMAIMMVLFYFMILKPTKQRQQSHQKLVATLTEGDEVISAGGIYGTITKVRDETIELEVSPGVRLKFDRRAIRRRAADGE